MILYTLVWSACALAAAQPVTALREGDVVAIQVAGNPFTAYTCAEDQKYPYFFPVLGPASGAPLTAARQEPYPHHSSLFFGCDRVNGGNYWQDSLRRGQIVPVETELPETGDAHTVRIRQACDWRQGNAPPILRDVRHITISAPGEHLRVIDFDIALEPLVEVQIEKSNHALFAARMHPDISVAGGGTLINAAGDVGESATFGKASPWMAAYHTRDGHTEGVAIVQHPLSTWADAPWFTRDYGFFSPTPMNWLEAPIVLKPGERVRQMYRVFVFAGSPESIGLDAMSQAFRETTPAAE